MDTHSTLEQQREEALASEVFGVKPELFLNELFNIVHCATADVMDSFGDFLLLPASSNSVPNSDVEELVKGVDGLHEKLVEQIEQSMTTFCDIALATCFSTPLGILKEVQMRRSLPPSVDSTKPSIDADESTLKSKIQSLLKEGKQCRQRTRQGEKRLEEIKRQRGLIKQDFMPLNDLMLSQQENLRQLRNLEERMKAMEGLICQGERLLNMYSVKNGTASLSMEQKATQVEKNIRQWNKIAGDVDLEAALNAWPF
eukprot:g6755.t1